MATCKETLADVPLFLLSPPYETVNPDRVGDVGALDALPPGSLAVLRPMPLQTWDQVRMAGEYLERRCVTASIVLRTDLVGSLEASRMAFHARTSGFQAVVPGSSLVLDDLRSQLTDAAILEDQFIRWLPCAGVPLDAAASATLRAMMAHAAERSTLKGIKASTGLTTRTLERRFRQWGLRPPGNWIHILGFFTRTYLVLQSQGSAGSVQPSPGSCAFVHTDLRRRCLNMIGEPPSAIRENLGWKWAMFVALSKRGLVPR